MIKQQDQICYYIIYNATKFTDINSMKQFSYQSIKEQSIQFNLYYQFMQYTIKHIQQIDHIQIIKIYKSIKQVIRSINQDKKNLSKILINQQNNQVIVQFSQLRQIVSINKFNYVKLEQLVKLKLCQTKIFKLDKPFCLQCKQIKSGICDENECHQERLFCLNCERIQAKHFFHRTKTIKYIQIDQIIQKLGRLKPQIVSPTPQLHLWLQILWMLNKLQSSLKTSVIIFMYEQGIYFCQYAFFCQSRQHKLIQSIYRSGVLNSTSLKEDFIQFMRQSSLQDQEMDFQFKFPVNFNKISLLKQYYVLYYDLLGNIFQIQYGNSLQQLLKNNLQEGIIIGTKTKDIIDKSYLQALYQLKSSIGIVCKNNYIYGYVYLLFTLKRNLIKKDQITDILWEDIYYENISYCEMIFLYDRHNAKQHQFKGLTLQIIR